MLMRTKLSFLLFAFAAGCGSGEVDSKAGTETGPDAVDSGPPIRVDTDDGRYFDFGLPAEATREYAGALFESPQDYGSANISDVSGDAPTVSGTEWPELYRREVWAAGPLTYRIPSENGRCTLHLHFCEYANPDSGAMVLDVFVNGVSEIDGLDLNAVGFLTAITRRVDIEVTEGEIEIEVRPSPGTRYSKISGVEIVAEGVPSRLESEATPAPPTPQPSVGTSGPTAAEIAIYRRRVRGETSTPFAEVGDVAPNSPGEWSRLGAATERFRTSMQGLDATPTVDGNGNRVTRDFYNFWNGPIAGRLTNGKGYWDGKGLIPTWATAKYEDNDGVFDPCDDGDELTKCQDATTKADDLLAASFYALVEDDAQIREDVRRVLLRQTDVTKAPGVDFSARSRWPIGRNPDVVVSTNPFFFTALWIVKIARAYEYSRVVEDGGAIVDSGAYSASDVQQIEGWLRDAGEYYRTLVEQFVVNDLRAFDSVEDRMAARDNGALNRAPGAWASGYRYWDGGPQPTHGQLSYQNRITESAMAFCVVGFTIDEPTFQRDCKLFFQEVMRYAVDANGYLGDFYRSELNGEKGLDYVSGQATRLVEMADLFARSGDASLYMYTTSEGAGTPCGHSSTGGTKNLRLVLEATGRFYQVAGHNGIRKSGALINADSDDAYRRYMQLASNFAQANVYYRDRSLADLVYLVPESGYRGCSSPERVLNTGYIFNPTRTTFGASVGQLFLYGGMETRERANWPYPGVAERPLFD